MKKIILENGGIELLVVKTQSMIPILKFNSLRALKNLLFVSDFSIKEAFIKQISIDYFLE